MGREILNLFVTINNSSMALDEKISYDLEFKLGDLDISPFRGFHERKVYPLRLDEPFPISDGEYYQSLFLLKAKKGRGEIVCLSEEQAISIKSYLDKIMQEKFPNVKYKVGILKLLE